jgi:hypothetical protein
MLTPKRHTAGYSTAVLRSCQVTSGGTCVTSGNREHESAILPGRMWTKAFLSLFPGEHPGIVEHFPDI